MPEEGPTITLPTDERLVAQLKAKLEEYKSRLDPYKAPQLQMPRIYSAEILEKLLKDGSVSTFDLAREFETKYGYVEVRAFNNACAVIQGYATNGGMHVTGGTGLPSIT